MQNNIIISTLGIVMSMTCSNSTLYCVPRRRERVDIYLFTALCNIEQRVKRTKEAYDLNHVIPHRGERRILKNH